jgi:hypothetical protein
LGAVLAHVLAGQRVTVCEVFLPALLALDA